MNGLRVTKVDTVWLREPRQGQHRSLTVVQNNPRQFHASILGDSVPDGERHRYMSL